MMTLDRLKAKNPHLTIHSVEEEAFLPYGRVLSRADDAILSALGGTEIPEEGNRYVASDDTLFSLPSIGDVAHRVFGGMPYQAGFCNGRGDRLNALEYHKCPEINCTTTGLVLLLALPSDFRDGRIDSASVRAFYLPPALLIEVHPLTLHFAPCRISDEGFRCLVVLARDVNTPLDHVDTGAEGEEKMLWMRGKWLVCHPDSPQAGNGAFTGITGDNLRVLI
ncbi:MAG: DUF4867 family protein [Lachnospiraceae bacterium]|nr:DUF4867 family protein [Lachnospiraceae bacterium]